MSALIEARESLTYWESRLQRLPRRAVRKRREARMMAARWRERVSEAERAEYGAGMLGAIFMVLAERRLPTHASRRLVRVGKGAVVVAGATVVAMGLLACLVLVAVLSVLL